MTSCTFPYPYTPPGLIQYAEFAWRVGPAALDIHCVEFDASLFLADAFQHATIALPPHIMYSVPKRQAEYFFGRWTARRALAKCGLVTVAIGTGPQREPLWPDGFIGSITHNDRYSASTALHATHLHGIGIDIESPIKLEHEEGIASLVLSDDEELVLHEASYAMPRSILLALAFSAKESFFKSVFAHARRILNFDAIRLRRIDPAAQIIEFQVTNSVSVSWPIGKLGEVHYMSMPGGDIATICAW